NWWNYRVKKNPGIILNSLHNVGDGSTWRTEPARHVARLRAAAPPPPRKRTAPPRRPAKTKSPGETRGQTRDAGPPLTSLVILPAEPLLFQSRIIPPRKRNPTRSSIGGPPLCSVISCFVAKQFGSDRYSRSLSLSVVLCYGFLSFDGVTSFVFRWVLTPGRFLDSNAAWPLSLPFGLGRGFLAFDGVIFRVLVLVAVLGFKCCLFFKPADRVGS
ncbi:hypothetical protein GW17_00047605, partial [Ensete ventricosum]